MVVFLIFFSIAQASIFAGVKMIDFTKKNDKVYEVIGKDIKSLKVKRYEASCLDFKRLFFKKISIDSDIGNRLMAKRIIGEKIDWERSLMLINKYQFRRNLSDKSGLIIAKMDGCRDEE